MGGGVSMKSYFNRRFRQIAGTAVCRLEESGRDWVS